ncbi:hypothetical protein RHSIM_Rhsim08G0225200 [Rhododendron simsii]|uniref:Uncharacterized protein n=1 Tax=Rhododendron simsii TaxID=118357 RepID=A0A834GT81_RHOSS|nr:hypothetical protein RHSIM_Rhsim08G0225200 [Rhododendron simsii]
MATLDSSNSPTSPSFTLRVPQQKTNPFLRSISTKEPSFSHFPSPPPRLSSQPSSPARLPFHAPSSKPLDTTNPDAATAASSRCVSSVLKKDGQILSVAASNGLVYTGSESNVVRVWKLPEFTECGQLKTKAGVVVAIEVSNEKVYVAYADCKIRVWRRSWEGVTRHVRVGTIPRAGSYVRNYIAGKDKMMKHMGPISSLALNSSDDILYSASLDKTVKVWRISDYKCIETIQAHSEPINAIALSDDGVLYTASDDATVRVWRRNFCTSNRPHSLTITLPAKSSPVRTLALTADGGVLYGGCSDGYIHYWLKGWFSGQPQYGGSLPGHTHAVMCLATVGSFVVSGSADLTGRVWVREQDGQHCCVAVLQGHRGPIRCVAAFPGRVSAAGEEAEDGCTVCTGSLDGVLKVWRVVNNVGRCLVQKTCEYFDLD